MDAYVSSYCAIALWNIFKDDVNSHAVYKIWVVGLDDEESYFMLVFTFFNC